MSIVLFAIIGAQIHAGTAYWICFAVYCMLKVVLGMCKVLKEVD